MPAKSRAPRNVECTIGKGMMGLLGMGIIIKAIID